MHTFLVQPLDLHLRRVASEKLTHPRPRHPFIARAPLKTATPEGIARVIDLPFFCRPADTSRDLFGAIRTTSSTATSGSRSVGGNSTRPPPVTEKRVMGGCFSTRPTVYGYRERTRDCAQCKYLIGYRHVRRSDRLFRNVGEFARVLHVRHALQLHYGLVHCTYYNATTTTPIGTVTEMGI